jgi:hypothetical protein
MKVNGRSTVLFEKLIQTQLVEDLLFFFNLDFYYCIHNSQALVHILIKMNPIMLSHSVLKCILIWSSQLRIGPLILLLSCLYALLPGQYFESATTKSFPSSSYCIRVVASCRHCKTNIQLCWRSPYTCSLSIFGF